jgi:lysophospholipase
MPHPPETTSAPFSSILNEPRFQEPSGWRWHRFSTTGGYRLRYGAASPENSIADAVVVILPGLSDFAEQYLELAHDLLARNLAVWVLDWRGQGGSDRYLPNPHKRHSAGFDRDIRDLHELVDGYILPSAVHPDVGRLPLVMLGHSMGAHLGLRFLHDCNFSSKGKQMFSVGAFCAPMFWIHQLDTLPISATCLISSLLCAFPTAYVPKGEDWAPGYRDMPLRKGKYSHDPIRQHLQEIWFTKDPALQSGGPTNKWLLEAARSCLTLNKASYLKGITVPTMIAAAEDDQIVSNRMTRRAVKLIPDVTYFEIPDARHEILMESDEYRQVFLDHFFTFVEENVLKRKDRGLTKF